MILEPINLTVEISHHSIQVTVREAMESRDRGSWLSSAVRRNGELGSAKLRGWLEGEGQRGLSSGLAVMQKSVRVMPKEPRMPVPPNEEWKDSRSNRASRELHVLSMLCVQLRDLHSFPGALIPGGGRIRSSRSFLSVY